ncbi:unnamed protein product, partial [Polarella glacialis]
SSVSSCIHGQMVLPCGCDVPGCFGILLNPGRKLTGPSALGVFKPREPSIDAGPPLSLQ